MITLASCSVTTYTRGLLLGALVPWPLLKAEPSILKIRCLIVDIDKPFGDM